jgi:hypothetical protein
MSKTKTERLMELAAWLAVAQVAAHIIAPPADEQSNDLYAKGSDAADAISRLKNAIAAEIRELKQEDDT